MMSADADGALLHAPVIKMIMSLAIDKLVYVVVARGQYDRYAHLSHSPAPAPSINPICFRATIGVIMF